MAKTSLKQSPPFSITDPKKVLNLCSHELKSLLGELGHTEVEKNSNRYIYSLIPKNPKNSITPDDRGNRYHIIPLLSTKSDNYWINISLTFLPNQSKHKTKSDNFQLSGVSITVYKGALRVLRAEWDTLKDDNNHAQPHWHVFKSFQTTDSNIFKKSDFTSSLSDEVKDFGASIEKIKSGENQKEISENIEETNFENEQKNRAENDWDSSTKFHFAMASQWHTPENNHRIILNQDVLPRWLEGCVKYVKEQLLYISR